MKFGVGVRVLGVWELASALSWGFGLVLDSVACWGVVVLLLLDMLRAEAVAVAGQRLGLLRILFLQC